MDDVLGSAPRMRSLPRPAGVEWFYLIAGLFLVVHYSWLLDDAFVYFRYVDNWILLDRGIVYNPGEYAEGYTSPLWMLFLSGTRLIGLSHWFSVKATGVITLILFWLLAIRINRILSPENAPVINFPLALLCLNYAVLCYFTSGTETPFVQLSAAAFVLFAIVPTWKPAQFALPLLPLVRPELVLVLVIALGWYRWKVGRTPWLMFTLSVLVSGGWLLFRIIYYADIFPTTFYLKNLTDIGQGFRFLHDTFAPYHLYEWFLLGSFGLVVSARREGRQSLLVGGRLLIAFAALLVIAYTVKVGGDARHYRYLAFPVCAAVLGLGGVAERWIGLAVRSRVGAEKVPVIAAAVGIAIAFLSFSLMPRQLDGHAAFNLSVKPRFANKIADAAHHRTHSKRFSPSPWKDGQEIELKAKYEQWRDSGGDSEPLPINRDAICFSHYEHFDHWAVHSFGLTDVVLSRAAVPAGRPGHKQLLPQLAAQLAAVLKWWGRPPERGMYRAAVENGIAAPWIRKNLATLELLERKLYNRHDFVENLRLALHIRERIEIEYERKSPRRAGE